MSKTPLNGLMLRAVTEAAMKQFTEVDSKEMQQDVKQAGNALMFELYEQLTAPGVQDAFKLLWRMGVGDRYTHIFLAVSYKYEINLPAEADFSIRARKYANYGAYKHPLILEFPAMVQAPREWNDSHAWSHGSWREERRRHLKDDERAIEISRLIEHLSPDFLDPLREKHMAFNGVQQKYAEWLQGKVERLMVITKTAKTLEDVLAAWPAGEQYRELFMQAARI
jgi:hypothetical protein